MTITASLAPPPPAELPLSRSLALGLAGAVAFGAAAGLGHGASAILRGAWMSPALFVGGALLALPPLYLASSWSGSRSSAEELVSGVADVLGRTGVILLGLSAPAAFFSATLHTSSAWFLLLGSVVIVGVTAVRAVARKTFTGTSLASTGWTLLALALGARTLLALSHTVTR